VLDKNRELQLLNAELQATRQMEAESARIAERLTIARELHDALGHHLAALSVNLQLATKLEGPEGSKAVQDAYLLARMLLSDVRHVVTDLRQLDAVSLRQAIETMAASIARPKILVEFDQGLDGLGPLPGHTLFRCAQEAITNAVRHAEAEHLWLRLERTARGYRLSARDDGRGALDLFYGHGLTGMRERVEELGGLMRCETRPGAGFTLEVEVPEKAVAA
jgi:signal transduction histidine kinase